MDDDKETQDAKQDAPTKEGSTEGSEGDKQSSQKQTELSKDDASEKEVQKRVSDTLAKKGDKVKPLEERIQTLETENLALKGERLQEAATKYGLTLEQVKEAGIEEPGKMEALAKLFGSAERQETKTLKADSSRTIGGDTMPDSAKGKITAGWRELHKT